MPLGAGQIAIWGVEIPFPTWSFWMMLDPRSEKRRVSPI